PSLERSGAGLDVDLGLATSGGAVEEEVASAVVQRFCDPRQGTSLRLRERRGLRLADEGIPCRRGLSRSTRAPLQRRDELERPGRRGPVVLREPEREGDERLRQRVA